MVKRKGLVYMIEATIALLIIFLFVLGNTVDAPSQDWSDYQDEVSATDLTYTLKQTGDLEKMIQRRDTGSIETVAESLTDDQLGVSGTVQELPLNSISAGFHTPDSEIHDDLEMRTMENGDECYNDLEEIEERKEDGSSIYRSNEAYSWHGTVLYFADLDPQLEDFDKGVWVDREADEGNECQFADEDGPYNIDEVFMWGDNPDNYYELKEINLGSDFRVHEATQMVRIRDVMDKPVNGIETSQEVETFDYREQNVDEYDIVILKDESVDELDSNSDWVDETNNFLEDSPVLLLADFQEEDLETGFLEDKGLEWVDLDTELEGRRLLFGRNSDGREIETYFTGLEGDTDNIDLRAQEKVSSSNSDTIMEDEKLFYNPLHTYTVSEWDSYSEMDTTNEDFEGAPETACNSDTKIGEFDFVDKGEVEVISTELGSSEENCDGLRGLNMDLSGDGDFGEVGPLLPGESVEVAGRNYNAMTEDSDEAEFVFRERDELELINYRESFDDFSGDRLATISYEDEYSQDDRKVIVSTIYWLVREDMEFGDTDSSISTSVTGSFNENTYMPYKTILRWE